MEAKIPSGNQLKVSDYQQDQLWAERQFDLAYDLYISGDWSKAELAVKKAMLVRPLEPRYRLLLAQIHSARGWLSMAMVELYYVRRQDPSNPTARALETSIRQRMRQQNESQRRGRPSAWSLAWRTLCAWIGH